MLQDDSTDSEIQPVAIVFCQSLASLYVYKEYWECPKGTCRWQIRHEQEKTSLNGVVIMALFNKSKFEDASFDANAKAKYQNSVNQVETPPKPQPQAPSNTATAAQPVARPAQSGAYGIQEAIELIRKLPNVNTDIVINVVIKTLESANISVEKIIQDAQGRETRIEDRSGRLISKIEALEAEIAELNEEITQLNTDLEETNKVKELLLRSLGSETETLAKQSPAPQPIAPKREAVAAAEEA